MQVMSITKHKYLRENVRFRRAIIASKVAFITFNNEIGSILRSQVKRPCLPETALYNLITMRFKPQNLE